MEILDFACMSVCVILYFCFSVCLCVVGWELVDGGWGWAIYCTHWLTQYILIIPDKYDTR